MLNDRKIARSSAMNLSNELNTIRLVSALIWPNAAKPPAMSGPAFPSATIVTPAKNSFYLCVFYFMSKNFTKMVHKTFLYVVNLGNLLLQNEFYIRLKKPRAKSFLDNPKPAALYIISLGLLFQYKFPARLTFNARTRTRKVDLHKILLVDFKTLT